jgi:putative ABC transport system ATP-binding protein
MMRVLSIEQVGRRYGAPPRQVVALDEVSLTVQAGEMLAVMGPGGSGKSTLLQLAGGLARPSSGRVVLCGIELSTLGEADLSLVLRRRVGFVFQDINLLAALTAAENVSLPLELDGVRPRRAMAAARALLSSLASATSPAGFPRRCRAGSGSESPSPAR